MTSPVLEILLRLAGLSLLGLAVLNALLPIRYGWREEFARVSLLSRQVFFVHAYFIGVVLVLTGLLALLLPNALLERSTLGLAITGGLALFWFLRLLVQWFGYSPRLWKGKPFETRIHLAATGLWIFYVITFGGAFWHQWGG